MKAPRFPRGAVLAAAAALLPGLPGAGAAEAAGPPVPKPECGFYCLAVGLRTFEIPGAGAAALRARLGDPGPEGYSLAELDRAATDLGAKTLAVRTSLANLGARRDAGERFAAIAHVDGNHFVLVSGFEPDGRVKLIDPPGDYSQPPETFAARWDGTALLISPDPLTAEADLAAFPWLTAGLAAAGGGCLLAVGGLWWRGRRTAAAGLMFGGALLGAAGCGESEYAVAAFTPDPPELGLSVLRPGTLPVGPGRHAAELSLTIAVGGEFGETRTLRAPVSAFVLDPAEVAAR